jgi:hypothetical protein
MKLLAPVLLPAAMAQMISMPGMGALGGSSSVGGFQEESSDATVADVSTDNVCDDNDAECQDGEIGEYKKKFEGIYDPNLYPYGPLHGDTVGPDSDDAVTNPLNLPSPFPLMDGTSTSSVSVGTNGILFLDSSQTTLQSQPESLGSSNSFQGPMVAGFWNDVWAQRHGRTYWRTELFNTTLLDELRTNAQASFPDITVGNVNYAVIASWWAVTHIDAIKKDPNQKWNTFQIVIWTDGTYSFGSLNYQNMAWNAAPGHGNAVAGYQVGQSAWEHDYSQTNDMINMNAVKTQSSMNGRHVFRLDQHLMPAPVTPAPPVTTLPPQPGLSADTCWPENDHASGGCIFSFLPTNPVDNGTCTVTFPEAIEWFHIFDAHVRVDGVAAGNTWQFVAANPTFEPGTDGAFQFIVNFDGANNFTASDVYIACDASDTYNYAVYSFPQNALQEDGRSNLRNLGNVWDPTATYTITLGAQVGNFTVDDPRISVSTLDEQTFALTNVPDSIEEIWFQWDYLTYFGSNEVGAQ